MDGKKSIFLAEPTPCDENIISQRKRACKILKEMRFDGIVYVPEYSIQKSNRKKKNCKKII